MAWLAASIATATFAEAHEFWIAPDSYQMDPGSGLSAQIRVGQDMSGEALPYLSRTIAEMRQWTGERFRAINAREGDLPAIDVMVDEPGLHRLTVVTNPAYIVFDTMADFSEYLAYEGLGSTVALHRERGLPETEFAEAYVRNARALVQAGPPRFDERDAPTGMAYELTVLGNPYLPGTSEVDVLLQWQGAAEAGTQVAIFHLPPGGTAPVDTDRRLARTDDEGRITVEVDRPGTYLLNAVHVEPVVGPGSVVWQSHWASLTFVISAAD